MDTNPFHKRYSLIIKICGHFVKIYEHFLNFSNKRPHFFAGSFQSWKKVLYSLHTNKSIAKVRCLL